MGYAIVLGPFPVVGVCIPLHFAPGTDGVPQCCLSAARPTIRTGERRQTQTDYSRRKGFIRDLFDVAAKGDGARIEDYVAKNKKRLVLERKFDLPEYVLVGAEEIEAIQQRSRVADGFPFNASVIFHVSSVGFNRDGTRALVYVGHNCGSLCGGGRYHFLVKKDGKWQVDREHDGISCVWAA
jgi:hypothetical protein